MSNLPYRQTPDSNFNQYQDDVTSKFDGLNRVFSSAAVVTREMPAGEPVSLGGGGGAFVAGLNGDYSSATAPVVTVYFAGRSLYAVSDIEASVTFIVF
jgi:hypothetical protein